MIVVRNFDEKTDILLCSKIPFGQTILDTTMLLKNIQSKQTYNIELNPLYLYNPSRYSFRIFLVRDVDNFRQHHSSVQAEILILQHSIYIPNENITYIYLEDGMYEYQFIGGNGFFQIGEIKDSANTSTFNNPSNDFVFYNE